MACCVAQIVGLLVRGEEVKEGVNIMAHLVLPFVDRRDDRGVDTARTACLVDPARIQRNKFVNNTRRRDDAEQSPNNTHHEVMPLVGVS
jgi:hypothetical protein